MTEQNNNEQNQNMPETAPEQITEPMEGAAVTAQIPVDPTTEMPAIDESAEPAKDAHGTVEANDVREPWYRKVGRSAGATAGVAVGALLVVGLTAGLSAFAGAQAGTFDRGHDRHALEQRIMHDDNDQDGSRPQMPDGNSQRDYGYGFGYDDRSNGSGSENGTDDRRNYSDRHHDRQHNGTNGDQKNQATPDNQNDRNGQATPDGHVAPDADTAPNNSQGAPNAQDNQSIQNNRGFKGGDRSGNRGETRTMMPGGVEGIA